MDLQWYSGLSCCCFYCVPSLWLVQVHRFLLGYLVMRRFMPIMQAVGPKKLSSMRRCHPLVSYFIALPLVLPAFVLVAFGVTRLRSDPLAEAESKAEAVIFLERVGTYSSGVTPLIPLLLLAAALALWAVCQLRRMRMAAVYPLANPFDEFEGKQTGGKTSRAQVVGISAAFQELRVRVQGTWYWPSEWSDWIVLLLVLAGSWYLLVDRWIPTAEACWCDIGLRLLIFFTTMLWVFLVIRLKAAAGLFERLLRRLSQHPIVFALSRVPDRLSAKVAGQVFAGAPDIGDLEPQIRILGQLARLQFPAHTHYQPTAYWPDGEELAATGRKSIRSPPGSAAVRKVLCRTRCGATPQPPRDDCPQGVGA